LEEISTALVLDAQLMVKDAMQYIKSCEAAGVDRIVAQVEHLNNKEEFIERASAVGMQVGLALDLQTPVAELEKQIHNLDVILLMSVLAGRSGQKFNPGVVEKIKAVAELEEITMESIRSVHKIGNSVTKVKLVGASAKDLASKIKDENVTTTGK
jgi:pentose-5-phosphate-3-epimerase